MAETDEHRHLKSEKELLYRQQSAPYSCGWTAEDKMAIFGKGGRLDTMFKRSRSQGEVPDERDVIAVIEERLKASDNDPLEEGEIAMHTEPEDVGLRTGSFFSTFPPLPLPPNLPLLELKREETLSDKCKECDYNLHKTGPPYSLQDGSETHSWLAIAGDQFAKSHEKACDVMSVPACKAILAQEALYDTTCFRCKASFKTWNEEFVLCDDCEEKFIAHLTGLGMWSSAAQ